MEEYVSERSEFSKWWAVNHPLDWWASELTGKPVNTYVRLLVWDIAGKAFDAGMAAASTRNK